MKSGNVCSLRIDEERERSNPDIDDITKQLVESKLLVITFFL